MSYNSKRMIANIIAGALVATAYIIYALSEHSPEPDDLKSWAVAMLVFIGIAIAAIIVVQILFHYILTLSVVIKHRDSYRNIDRIINSITAEDERDNIIELKTGRIGYAFAGLGFIFMLLALATGMSGIFALHVMLGSTSAGSLFEGIASVYYYEMGVGNG